MENKVTQTIEFSRADLERGQGLQKRGIKTLTDVSNLERQLTMEEARQLQVLNDLSDGRRGIGTLKRQLAELEHARHMQALIDLQTHTAALATAIGSRRTSEEQLMLLSALSAQEMAANREVVLDFTVRRSTPRRAMPTCGRHRRRGFSRAMSLSSASAARTTTRPGRPSSAHRPAHGIAAVAIVRSTVHAARISGSGSSAGVPDASEAEKEVWGADGPRDGGAGADPTRRRAPRFAGRRAAGAADGEPGLGVARPAVAVPAGASGLALRPFVLVKFRTMDDRRDADGMLLPDQQRETRITRWIRRARLDEIPQLLAILAGDMNFIGPRPLKPETIASFVVWARCAAVCVRVSPAGRR